MKKFENPYDESVFTVQASIVVGFTDEDILKNFVVNLQNNSAEWNILHQILSYPLMHHYFSIVKQC